MRTVTILLAVAVLAGCKSTPELPAIISPYKIDIQQGNAVTQDMVAKLKSGMTRSQVRFLLGSPLVVDPFRTDRWDYVYLYQRQGKVDERRRLTVIFVEDKLVRLEGDVVLTDSELQVQPPAPPVLAPKPEARPPAAATPAPKPVQKPAVAGVPAAKPVEKPAPVAPPTPVAAPAPGAAPAPAPVAPPAAAASAAPPAPSAAAVSTAVVKPDLVAPPERKEAAPPAKAPAVESKTGIAPPEGPKAEAPKAQPAKADTPAVKPEEPKDKPKDKGTFGRMMDKIGF